MAKNRHLTRPTMRVIVLELTGKHENIRLGHLQLLSLFVGQARTHMASVNELHSNTDLC